MDPDGESQLNDSPVYDNTFKAPPIYYGVHIPNEPTHGDTNVFEDKDAALKVAKKHKKSRFKAFQFYHEAVDFSINGFELPNGIFTLDNNDGAEKKEANNVAVGEKASPFRTPRPQELTDFRNKIESGNLSFVKTLIDYNPRFLVSSGDTPSILQEGARLNALHVAAKVKNAEITDFILQTIGNPEFVKKLYGDDNQCNAEQRCKMLLDLYLNTPNKGFNDTPLHIAAKWGAEKVVEVLLSYPQCDKTKRNKHNKLAEDVICERTDSKTPAAVKHKIQQLLCDNYYVPVLRTEDNTLPPLIGQPFSPTSPPLLNRDPLSPRLEIHAYAGPMDKKEAETFRRVWKTPPRSLNLNSPNGKKPLADNLTSLRLKDPQKGLERIGKRLANDYNICWKEYWDFLDSFVDIASDDGLALLEGHLKRKESELLRPVVETAHTPLMTKQETAVSPVTSLCNAFSACTIQDSSPGFFNDWKSPVDSRHTCRPLVYVDKACQVFANRFFTSVSALLRCTEREYGGTLQTLEADVKLLELLINSYLSDERFFDGVNFQKTHSRLADLVAKKLRDNYKECQLTQDSFLVSKLESVLECLVKRSDYFSSDDEGANCKDSLSKPTMHRKQVVCLLSRIKACLESNTEIATEEDYTVDAWRAFTVCNCVFHARKAKRNNLSRNSSFKNHSNNRRRKHGLEHVSKKLYFGEDLLGANGDLGLSLSSDSSKSDSDDEFYTPVSSPTATTSPECSDSEDQFSDAELPKVEVFLEGVFPTKTDHAVFNALRYADCDIDLLKYPHVYKWHHSVSLYKESEREAWPSPRGKQNSPERESPDKNLPTLRPSWLRITGANSPRAAFKSFGQQGNR